MSIPLYFTTLRLIVLCANPHVSRHEAKAQKRESGSSSLGDSTSLRCYVSSIKPNQPSLLSLAPSNDDDRFKIKQLCVLSQCIVRLNVLTFTYHNGFSGFVNTQFFQFVKFIVICLRLTHFHVQSGPNPCWFHLPASSLTAARLSCRTVLFRRAEAENPFQGDRAARFYKVDVWFIHTWVTFTPVLVA